MLAALLGALYAIARRLRNRAFWRARGRRFVAVVETTIVTPQLSLHVLRLGGRYVLIGAGSCGARTIAHWASDDASDDASNVEVGELRDFVAGTLD